LTYQLILVGTDGSDTANRAVAEAAELAGRTGAQLLVTCVYDEPGADELEEEAAAEMAWHVTAVAQAEDLVFKGREIAARQGVRSEGRAVPGRDPGPAILSLADELDADLIVVGSVGLTGAKRFLLGSVPGHIIHNAGCDVLVARTDT